ncbi:hypothetical protein HK104_004319 [Borealophlyctis nickersoniae]|nr:hypothetical protein HK104_004319 [Borealophlyctis nickersoniae]
MTKPEEKQGPVKVDGAPAPSPVDGQKKKENPEKEAKRLAKLAKFEAKKAAEAAKNAAASGDKKEKKDKKKPEPKTAAEETPFVNTTPKGEKKDVSGGMANAYDPTAVEAAWYDWWEKQGLFKPELTADGKIKPEGKFVIPIPPPNVTGSLHLGHALTNSIQDCLTRWHRMQGKSALFVPGCDHAGIATQIVVEKKLMRERGITRHSLGRQAFVDEVWKWKDAYGHRIYDQLRRLGSSLDWDRVRFTMDPSLNKAVTEAFVRLHEDGTIYRANRLVNWCTKLNTALSNLEVEPNFAVEMEELEGRTMRAVPDHDNRKYEFGVIISFAYQVENSDERIIVATTRLETMLGDTAVCVNPKDARYTHLHGKYVIHPFNNRRIPIITDDYADPEFGTGAVKITPAHDFNDYNIGKRHNLEFINILTDDGLINENGAPFTGIRRFDARVAVQKALEEKGLYIETKDNKMQIPICTRSGNVVEPMLKPQWWVNCQEMAQDAMQAVRSGELNIVPETSEKEWFRWLENIQDWCISRQLWWGHRVPAYFIRIKGQDGDENDAQLWVSGRDEEEARKKAVARFPNVSPSDITLEQGGMPTRCDVKMKSAKLNSTDPDVLDTWFSSGLWPFSIMGWPEQTKDLDLFFPNSLLETGRDILFFWVVRMVMMSQKLTGKVPFKQVFCHAMVRDAHGRKMSKSLGNVIDPIDVIEGITLSALGKRLDEGNLDPREVAKAKEGQKRDYPNGIPKCGTDALRFALLAYTSGGRDINLDVNRVEGYRKFCNKLWNATKLVMMKLGDDYKPSPETKLTGTESLADLWIIAKLNKASRETNKYLEQLNFMQATSTVYQFWLTELCDVYLEICKPVVDGDDAQAKEACRNVLYICLDAGLKLLHPFMPFVTEELYQRLPRRSMDTSASIMTARYPQEIAEWNNAQAEKDYEFVNDVAHAARSLMTDYSIKEATLYVQAGTSEVQKLMSSQAAIVRTLARGIKNFNVVSKDEAIPAGCAPYNVTEDCTVFLLVKGHVDFEVELKKLDDKLANASKNLATWKKKTEAEGYETKVKAEIKEINENKIKGYEAEIEALQHAKDNFMRLRDA